MRLRDSRRKKLYTAENESLPEFSKPLENVHDIEKYLIKIWNKKVLKRKFPTALSYAPPKVQDGRGTKRAYAYGTHSISIPIWARTQWIVIHEIAHTINNRTNRNTQGHGWEFCAIYLDIVKTMLGSEAHSKLKIAMRKHKVRYRKPKPKRPMTPEVLEQLRARMAVARAARGR